MLLLSSVWRWLLTTLSLLVMCALASGASLPDLMPMPAHISPGAGRLVIDGNFSVRIPSYSNRQLADAVTQFTARVSRQTGIPITGGELPTLTIECRAAAPDYPTLGEDESYQLEVTPELAHLSAHSVTGALRGLQTFSQLIARRIQVCILQEERNCEQPGAARLFQPKSSTDTYQTREEDDRLG